ncbi:MULTISPECIES: DMT family transporter [Delftia]|jgi:drug/metabolite transporter (DMT)-like permease|uniref:DMT family transporter n=1 Tax=Delftia TaxID=80865 RepID=UPI0003110B83|nr:MULTISPECIES: DMT family transporter [Delftia]MDH0775708.1 DMT family transporter [Delftia tsuruhatensis]MDH1459609.1 DMT family transporter [Delftia tsuruhatensis]MDH1826026.1 DMT family transporter [Delftia tsuruhatensis]MPT54381.1 DMT family transporter [Delftia sp.]WGG09807.1 DMT family transporter [Delftia tsuruhatensis]
MLESIQGFSWLWVPITLFAALAQTVRNTAQRSLTQELGALSATLVRFLYGLPFAMLWLALLYLVPAKPYAVPSITPIYLGWIALGAFFQLAGTVALLLAMKERNFAVAVTLTKTEVLQLALFASVFLHELPTPLALAAMIVATIGMLLLSLPPREQLLSPSAWLNRSALYGLACGSCFAVATVGFRGGSLALGAETAWLSGAWGVLIAQSMQTVGMGLWIQLRTAQGLAPIFRAWRISLLAGCMGAAASIAWFTAYAMQGASPVRTLGMIEVVFSYLVSRRVFSESFSRTEKIGMGLMLLGLVVTCLQA